MIPGCQQHKKNPVIRLLRWKHIAPPLKDVFNRTKPESDLVSRSNHQFTRNTLIVNKLTEEYVENHHRDVVRRNSDRGKLSRTNDLVSSAINCKAERERAESFFGSWFKQNGEKNFFKQLGKSELCILILRSYFFLSVKMVSCFLVVFFLRFPIVERYKPKHFQMKWCAVGDLLKTISEWVGEQMK